MFQNDMKLGSVNWETGMLLKPEHFLRQERYFDSRLLWLFRYTTTSYGLIGSGPRLPEVERGTQGSDPVVSVNDDADTLSITVAQCRGLTPAGCPIDIQPERPAYIEIPKHDMEGVSESRIYVVCDPHEKELAEAEEDALNPEREKEWFPTCRIALKVEAGEAPYALAVGRIARARDGVEFDRDPHFIPTCAFIDAHSELKAGAHDIQERVIALASRFTELHRAMRQFIFLFKDRGVDTENDIDTMQFTGRMVVALQNCVYEIMDTTQPPQSFFGHLRRFIHSAAVYLDLSPPVRQYFDLLKESGQTEFMALLEQQKKSLGASPKWRIHEDLSEEVTAVLNSIEALQTLERALEGKYIDFRFNPLLEAMNFIFDREGQVLYKLPPNGKSTRFQGVDDMRTITFAKLQLEGREKYRLVLIGEDNAIFDREIRCEIYINENSGMRSKPRYGSCAPKKDQCNFEFDFEAPDVPTITELRVTLTADHPIKLGMLFVRQRFHADRQPERLRHIQHEEKPRPEIFREETPRPRAGSGGPAPDRQAPRRIRSLESDRTVRDGETLRAGRDRDYPVRTGREPGREVDRDRDRDREAAPRSGREPDAPRRSFRDFDREPPKPEEWDAPPERSRDARRGDEWEQDGDDPPPSRRKRFQD